MTLVRFTVIDAQGAVSFVGPGHAIKMFAAACSRNPRTLVELLEYTRPYDADFISEVRKGLAVFDEHNTTENYQAIHAALDFCKPHEVPVFRVVDDRTRQASLTPVRAGVVVFNLRGKRIIQIHNTYAEIRRRGRVRIMDGSRPTNRVVGYELPQDWALVP